MTPLTIKIRSILIILVSTIFEIAFASSYNEVDKQESLYRKALDSSNAVETYTALKQYLLLIQADLIKDGADFTTIKSKKETSNIGLNGLDLKKTKQIKSQYFEKLRKEPNCPIVNYNLGILYARSGDIPKAVLCFRRSLKEFSSFKTLYSLGLSEMLLRNYRQAHQYFKEALHHQRHAVDDELPYSKEFEAILYNNLFICSKHIDHADSAETKKQSAFYIEQAITLNSGDYRFYLNKAEQLKEMNNYRGYSNQIRLARKLKEKSQKRQNTSKKSNFRQEKSRQ